MENRSEKSKKPRVVTDSGQDTDASSSTNAESGPTTSSASSTPQKDQTKVTSPNAKSPKVKSPTKSKFMWAVEEVKDHCRSLIEQKNKEELTELRDFLSLQNAYLTAAATAASNRLKEITPTKDSPPRERTSSRGMPKEKFQYANTKELIDKCDKIFSLICSRLHGLSGKYPLSKMEVGKLKELRTIIASYNLILKATFDIIEKQFP